MGRAPVKTLPSQETLRGLFHYEPETGALTWKRQAGDDRRTLAFNNKCGGKQAGTIAKTKGDKAYLAVAIRDPELGNKIYLAQRLIWKWMTGEEPPEQVDHEDNDRLNNRWKNLRAADNGKNMMNTAPRSRSGFKGVYWSARHKKYRAVVKHPERLVHVGYFADASVAAAQRHLIAIQVQGEFARTFA